MQTAHTGSLRMLIPEVHLVSNNTHRDFILRRVLEENKGNCKMNPCFLGEMILHHPLRTHTYLNLIHPCSDVQEAAFRSDVVEEQDAMSLAEIGPGNAAKPTGRRVRISFSFKGPI